MLDSSLFVKALGIGIAVAAPVGPMSLLCMRTTLTRGCGVSNMRSAELVGVAQPIACCGKFGGVGGRRQIAQRRVRSPPIVVVDPARDPFPRVIEPKEQAFVEKLVAHAAVEALAKAVLHRLSRRDETPDDLVVPREGEHGVRGEPGPVVRDDHAGLAAPLVIWIAVTRPRAVTMLTPKTKPAPAASICSKLR